MTALFGGVIKPFASSHWILPSLIYFKIRRWGQTIYIAVGTVQERGGGGRFFVGGICHCPFITLHKSHRTLGVLPMMAYTGRLRPKGVRFFTLQVYERVGISLVKVYILGFVITARSAKKFIISLNFPCFSLFTELFACVVFLLLLFYG